MRISDWSSDVCSSDLRDGVVELQHPHLRLGLVAAGRLQPHLGHAEQPVQQRLVDGDVVDPRERHLPAAALEQAAVDDHAVGGDAVAEGQVAPHCHYREAARSEEQTSELQSLMRIPYAVFCLTKKINTND